MADTGRTIRASRTQTGGNPYATPAPTERSRVVGHEVRQVRTETGLEGLSQSFAQFFSLASDGLASVQEGVLRGEQQRIEQQNVAQKRQALGDALAGKPMDQTLSGDLDYYDAFRAVKAQRDGYDAYQEFNQFYLNEWLPANPTGDLMSAREEWARANLVGSDDPDYEGQVLASFFETSDSMIPKHQEFALKFQTAKGVQALGSAIDAQVASGTLSPASLSAFIENAKALDPLNSTEAPARVASALIASAANHPEQMVVVASLLDQPGTGVNGKSFAESWPEAYATFQSEAVASYNAINSAKELEAITAIEDNLRNAKTAEELVQVAVDTYRFRQTYGAPGKTAAILDEIARKGAVFDEQETSFQSIDAFLQGDEGAADPADIRKNWTAYLESRVGTKNIMDVDHETAAQIVQGLNGVVPEEVKLQISASLTDTRDPAGQAKAVALINTVTATVGKGFAGDYLSATAAQMYEQVYAISQTTSEPMESILARVNEARDGIKDWDASWQTITGETEPSKANQRVRKVIDDELWTLLGQPGLLGTGIGGQSVNIPPTLVDTVMEVARTKAIEAAANGRGWEAGIKDAMASISENAEVIPGADGRAVLQLNAGLTSRYVDETGKEAVRPRLGFNVFSPTTGQPVNTLQVYRDQLSDLARKDGWIFQGGTPEGVSLSPRSSSVMTSRGLLEVQQDGIPLVFAAGDEVVRTETSVPETSGIPRVFFNKEDLPQTTETTVTIPDNEAGMEELFGDMPEGFMFLKEETAYGVMWRLGYRPNFGEHKGLTLDQREAGFQP